MFLSGVIEGFYGRAWTAAQRLEMIDWIGESGMNTFIYGPKDDIKIRARWRELYTSPELRAIIDLAEAARDRNQHFIVAISPCLDITYSAPQELETLKKRMDQLINAGIEHFVLLYDDIPNELSAKDAAEFPSFAAAQCHIVNAAFAHLRQRVPAAHMLFCPTEYCADFANRDVPNSTYLREIGEKLHPEIGVFWTGPDIVSENISVASLEEIGSVLKRKPVIWDNYHANDYDIRRVYAGPLGGRHSDILPLISGIITNPNNEFEANFVPVHTTGRFARPAYDEHEAFEAALEAWQPRFQLAYSSTKATLSLPEVRLLAELFYQPFSLGPQTEAFIEMIQNMLSEHRPDTSSKAWGDGHNQAKDFFEAIRQLFDRMTELENRDLFYAFHPYLWEVREETTHLLSYLDWLIENPPADENFPQEDRVYNFYRRGLTVTLQELLPRDKSGQLHHGA